MSKNEEEHNEEYCFEEDLSDRLNLPDASIGGGKLVASPTTDTLDSVILEPSPSEDVSKNEADLKVKMEDEEFSKTLEARKEVPEVNLENADEEPIKPGKDQANISSYFLNSDNDFFDSLNLQSSKQSSDMFTSIAISKSEEDIRVSEMNATEIQLPPSSESLNSPVSEEFAINRSFENVRDVLVEDLESEVNVAHEDDVVQQPSGNEDEADELLHIRHREHTTSTSEPEAVVFEGEPISDVQVSDISGISDIEVADKDQFEDFTAQGEEETMQLFSSKTPQASNIPPSPASQHATPSHQTAVLGALNPLTPAAWMHELTVGTTPSQMSPLGTPVHQSTYKTSKTSETGSGLLQQSSDVLTTNSLQSGDKAKIPESVLFPSFGSEEGKEDSFSAIMTTCDSDRRHDAWIPSDATRQTLVSPPTQSVTELSTPGILNTDPLGDPVKELVLRFMGEQEAVKRNILTTDSVSQDIDGLRKLIESGCLRAAIDLTGHLLDQAGQGFGKTGQVTLHTQKSLQLWFCRLSLMVKLRMFDTAEAEMRAFQSLDTPDLYYQYYPNIYPGRRGSMVPFSMRLLHAELPLLNGRSQDTLDRLYYMLAVCNRIQINLSSDLSEDGVTTHMTAEARKASMELWNQREIDVKYRIGSSMLAVKDYEGALRIYTDLLDKETNSIVKLKAGIGRVHLQMGNIHEASIMFKEIESEVEKNSSLSCFNLLSKGLLAMSSNNFYDAYQHFKSAVLLQPQNTCAVNNMAVCSLYLGRLKDALNTLEHLVHSDPINTLHEGVLFNLCTLYELETSRALHKKQAILDLVSKHKGDGFPVACLKMT